MKKPHKMTKHILKAKILGILFFFLVFSITPLPGQRVRAWETFASNVIQSMLEQMLAQMWIMITGALKQAAIKMVTSNVTAAIGGSGGGGGAKFIVDWRATLTGDPKQKATLYIEQLSRNSTQMKGSSFYMSSSSQSMANQFEGVGESDLAQYFQSPRFIDSANAYSGSSGSSENYSSLLSEIGKSVTSENDCSISDVDPATILQSGTFKDLENFTDPYTYRECFRSAYEKELSYLEKEAETKAIAYQGFLSTEQSGNTTYPGILVKEKMANVEDMGNKALTTARGIGEVIVSMVMQMGMNAMNNGIGNVKSQVQRNTTNTSERSQSQTQNQVNNQGPGALYGNTSNSQ